MRPDSELGPASNAADPGLLFDLAPLALLALSPDWRITKTSARFLADWGVSVGDCVGEELLPFVAAQLRPTRPTQLAQLTTSIDDALAARADRLTGPISTSYGASWRARIIPIFRQDELLSIVLEWHEGLASPVETDFGKSGFSTDEAFRLLVQNVKDYAICLLDPRGHIITWNAGAELLKGYTRDEIIGKHFSVFYGKADLDINKPQVELDICMHDGRIEDEGWRCRKDGSQFWADVVMTTVYKDGLHVGFGIVTRDLTERKSSESRLIAAYEESEKLKSDFLANMSHEIRTPMHGMLAACALLLDTALTTKQREMVGVMDESGQVLLQVIDDILDYSKLTSGNFSMQSGLVGVTGIITLMVRSLRDTSAPAVHFELFLDPDLPRSAQGDPLRYRQILQNLVSNAAKFTDKGSIRVAASVESEDDSGYTILAEVTDTGIGIPEDAAANLFTPFTQFDGTTTKRYKGTGLGLSIAKSLAELMDGRIGYRPNPDRQGSVFWFTAHFKKIQTLEGMQERKTAMALEGNSGEPPPPRSNEVDSDLLAEIKAASPTKHMLVVEDNLINQKVMVGMLRALSFQHIELASNGLDAVKMVRRKPAAYDMVLMDISMPVMDGNTAAREIRAAGILLPIVAMTAHALKGDRERCLEHGMNDYIAKPVDKKLLVRLLVKWLLRTTDYRKNHKERLAELQRYRQDMGQALTPSMEGQAFSCQVPDGLGTPGSPGSPGPFSAGFVPPKGFDDLPDGLAEHHEFTTDKPGHHTNKGGPALAERPRFTQASTPIRLSDRAMRQAQQNEDKGVGRSVSGESVATETSGDGNRA
ncbi:hypothetical protein B0J18DRAFT_164290 [Chaetomium sp. MPI-SDFR-AT-0129]|nr:hypothetical protein B0J18DRAFT_164290 [Chaetomium sp. MPI-SDFR-AT-0129]